jgi:hypothetical protein
MPLQCRERNRFRFHIRVSVTQTGSITAIVAVDSFSGEEDHRSNFVNLDWTRRISIQRTDRHEEIGGGIDGDQARTLYVTDAISSTISRWIVHTHLRGRRLTKERRRRVKGRRLA